MPPEGLPTDSRGPTVLATIWTFGSVSGIFLGLRVYCKIWRQRRLWWDDYILIASWISLLVFAAIQTWCVSLGDGMHIWLIDPANLPPVFRATTIASAFAICAIAWSKTSFAVTLLRLTMGKTRMFLWFVIVSINVAMALVALFLMIACWPIARTWDPNIPGSCWSPKINEYYGIGASAYSGFMDIVLAFLPWQILLTMRMEFREKVGVLIAMSMGVFAGVTAFMKCAHIDQLSGEDFTYTSVDLVIWSAAESTTTIIASSIPVLRTFVHAHASQYYKSGGDNSAESGRLPSFVKPLSKSHTRTTSNAAAANNNNIKNNINRQDDQSDRSILYRRDGNSTPNISHQPSCQDIIETTKVTIEFREREESDGYQYELDELPSTHNVHIGSRGV
ncbi:hypothetical protein QBC46DRAFT_401243 [Diplogelasinospora grovesii]|uniref:Rhodopsin domain-containing protein n=1 Tax=Diplogelasinospora grovesii TaxID=303347 RepID=A0AAN6RXS6_9PEZI|nr:hypothetical protein QBC46DRAFT_401243 [Diplogelasinospora grovesii]